MPNHMMSEPILLVGTGNIAKDYAKVLKAQNVPFIAVGRGEESAKVFEEVTDVKPVTGGLDKYLATAEKIPQTAIIAAQLEYHGACCLAAMQHGIRKILVEKSAGLTVADVAGIADAAKEAGSQVSVAYNRRFYASTLAAEKIIAADGGVTSFNFECTEIRFNPALGAGNVHGWMVGNASHVIDLAFYLGGDPVDMHCLKDYVHTDDCERIAFTGCGRSDLGALFSYQANWVAPGRWALEVLTKNSRLIFRPMEKLQIQRMGFFQIEEVEIDDSLDKEFKPGLFREVECFLNTPEDRHLVKIDEQVHHMQHYVRMLCGVWPEGLKGMPDFN